MNGIDRAIAELRTGRAVVFPTDTVYGVGVAVRHAASPQEIYGLKRRDAGKPIAWLVGGPDDLDRFGRDVPVEALLFACAHWPGALTLVVNASDEVPPAYAPTGTIGLRMPASDTALALIRAAGPIAASSANRSGAPAPRTFADLDPALVREAAFALGDDRPSTGIASTVIDATQRDLRVLREGGIRL